MKTHEKLRVCECCGEAKQSYMNFSYNAKRNEYSHNCKSCGCWLTLLRRVFGETRDWEGNRREQERRNLDNRFKNQAANDVFNAWYGR